MKKLEELEFDNAYARLSDENEGAYATRVEPAPAPEARLLAFNPAAAALIGLDPAEASRPEFVEAFSGHRSLPGFDPVAMVYSGHQFGVRVPRLGDGRAILLGQCVGPGGTSWDLHLKGSGQTPFSRQGDGRAVLRSSIREYLCGEAMHGLGIPTTRSLCLVASSEPVFREEVEPRAQIVRMAPSHVRFGSFEYFYFRHHAEPELRRERLRRLADHVISRHYPELAGDYGGWLKEIALRTARMIAGWQAVGWAHGVMNTDNFSILGLTLDYGPFGFMDDFDWRYVPNHSDSEGRYSFDQQPRVGLWNLNVLAGVLLPLMDEDQARSALEAYEPEFHRAMGERLRAKLGLRHAGQGAEDTELVRDFLGAMLQGRADYTLSFRELARVAAEPSAQAGVPVELEALFEPGEGRAALARWLEAYRARLRSEGQGSREGDAARAEAMNRVNPKYVLRNFVAQRAIEEATSGRFGEIEKLRKLFEDPYEENPAHLNSSDREFFGGRPPEWGRHLVLSCSS